jgi:hypothetical protein
MILDADDLHRKPTRAGWERMFFRAIPRPASPAINSGLPLISGRIDGAAEAATGLQIERSAISLMPPR